MDKVSRQAPKRLGLEATLEPHLLQALKGAKMPATQSALSRIATRKTSAGYAPLPQISDIEPDRAGNSSAPIAAAYGESLLRAIAQSLQAWRCQLPPHLQPGLLALVHGGAPIEVHAIALYEPGRVRLSGSCQGKAYKSMSPLSEVQFVCVPRTGLRDTAAACITFELGAEVFSA